VHVKSFISKFKFPSCEFNSIRKALKISRASRQICQLNEGPILPLMDTSNKHVEQLPNLTLLVTFLALIIF